MEDERTTRQIWTSPLFRVGLAIVTTTFVVGVVALVGASSRGNHSSVSSRPPPSESADETTGLSVSLEGPARAEAGELIQFELTVRDDAGTFDDRLLVKFGDGKALVGDRFLDAGELDGLAGDTVCTFHIDGPDEAEPPTRERRQLVHAYRTPGSYTVAAEVATGGCASESERATARATLEIHGERVDVGNGPVRPEASVSVVAVGEPGSEASVLNLGGFDRDGYVRTLEIDWGDGTPPDTFRRGLAGCPNPTMTWPTTGYAETASHDYSEPGEYRLTLTVSSTDCVGGATQVDTTKESLTTREL